MSPEQPWVISHPHPPHSRFDGGDLDCGSGLLLLIRQHLNPLDIGGLLEIVSREKSVAEDLPSWSRLTGNTLISQVKLPDGASFLVSKGPYHPGRIAAPGLSGDPLAHLRVRPGPRLPVPGSICPVAPIPPLAVVGIGSWPRPGWLLYLQACKLEGRPGGECFEEAVMDATRLAVACQERAEVDLVTDGEQARENYAAFVGSRLGSCRLVPVTDLVPLVEDPAKFQRELEALDVPPGTRHPVALAPLVRDRVLAVEELRRAQACTRLPVKVALPGPYLLSRTLFLDCLAEKHHPSREALAAEVVQVLRDEICHLLAEGAALVQLDEPVLTEVVFGRARGGRSFMCGALSARKDPATELAVALDLWREVTAGLPRDRLALHVCRGNWSKDETVALAGDYRPLLPTLSQAPVGTLFLELATPRAGEMEVLRDLPGWMRLGLGLVNPKLDALEDEAMLNKRVEQAIAWFGAERLLLTPDCGFATFSTSPLASQTMAQAKLALLAKVARSHRAG